MVLQAMKAEQSDMGGGIRETQMLVWQRLCLCVAELDTVWQRLCVHTVHRIY